MHRVGYVLGDGFQLMSLSTQAVFEYANVVAAEPVYEVTCYSALGGEVKSSMGVSVLTKKLGSCTAADSWMVAGVSDPLSDQPAEEVLRLLSRAIGHSRRVAGLCTGAFVLAEAGLLDERRATTHWAFAEELKNRYSAVKVDVDRIYVLDGPIWTSAGMSAVVDLALAMVESDLGDAVAKSVARKLVMHQRRTGGQSQHSEMLDVVPKSDRIQNALAFARSNLKRALSVEELAEVASLSPRQFSRAFSAETGLSPARAIEGLRLEAARLMIERSRHSLDVIARESGFRDRRHLRDVFVKRFGTPPQSTRRAARGQDE
jgi:transcriptional regulator GlxA family with amidase domain